MIWLPFLIIARIILEKYFIQFMTVQFDQKNYTSTRRFY